MKVKEFIKKLQTLDPERNIFKNHNGLYYEPFERIYTATDYEVFEHKSSGVKEGDYIRL